MSIDKKLSNEVVEILEDVCHKEKEILAKLNHFRIWLDQLVSAGDADKIKSIIIGCAIFRRNAQSKKLFSRKKSDEWEAAKFKIEVSQIFLDITREYFSLLPEVKHQSPQDDNQRS